MHTNLLVGKPEGKRQLARSVDLSGSG